MADTGACLIHEPEEPIPPRFWWLKRIAVGLGVLVVMLGLLRWWWGVHAHAALQAAIDRCRAAGEPILAEDFDLPPVPDEDNAALLLKRAVAALSLTQRQKDLLDLLPKHPEMLDQRREEAARLMSDTAAARALVHEARFRSAADWGPSQPNLDSADNRIRSFKDYQFIGRTMALASMELHRQRDDAGAVEALRDLLAFCQSIERLRDLRAWLLDCGLSEDIASSLQDMVQTLSMEIHGQAREPAAINPSRAAVQGLIGDLIDERALRESFLWGTYREQWYCLSHAQRAISNRGYGLNPLRMSRFSHFMFRPMLELDCVRVLDYWTPVLRATRASNWPRARACLPQGAPGVGSRPVGLRQASRALSMYLLPQLDHMVGLFEAIACRRLAATALAIRLYELDHGELPASLDALVPSHLPAVPRDPFAEGDQPLLYAPTGQWPYLGCREEKAYRRSVPFYLHGRPTTRPASQLSPGG